VPVTAALGHQRELQKYPVPTPTPASDCLGTRETDSDWLPNDEELGEVKAGDLPVQNMCRPHTC
jgi:hypothetical protein